MFKPVDKSLQLNAKRHIRRGRRAFFLSALIPGLGQMYQRRYLTGAFFLVAFFFPFYYVYIVGFSINYGLASLLISQFILFVLQLLDAKSQPFRQTSPCEDACPLHVNVPSIMSCVEGGEYDKAYGIMCFKTPFAYTLASLCNAPCQLKCGLLTERPLRIKDVCLSTFETFLNNVRVEKREPIFPLTSRRVAIIGSGISGLTAAYFLSSCGISVDVFDENDPGGMLNFIPSVNKETLRKEVKIAMSFENLRFFKKSVTKIMGYDYTLESGKSMDKKLTVEVKNSSIIYPLQVLGGLDKLNGKKIAIVNLNNLSIPIVNSLYNSDISVFHPMKLSNAVIGRLKHNVKLYQNYRIASIIDNTIEFQNGAKSKFDIVIPCLGLDLRRSNIGMPIGNPVSVVGAVKSARNAAYKVLSNFKLTERAWFVSDVYVPKPNLTPKIFPASEASLCKHCGMNVRS